MVDFIGIGAQKAGTSWIYACLYEHPQICAPIKEIHFFSRQRFEKGKDWYERHFQKCDSTKIKGEFSTSYLYSEDAPKRIAQLYPATKIIAVLRNPVDRAYSQYRNSIKAGEINEKVSFEDFAEKDASVIGQGKYAGQLQRYYEAFAKEQILVLLYEDIQKDPASFIKSIYRFLDVDDAFVPSMLHTKVNIARTPKSLVLERGTHHIAEFLRKIGLDKLVWIIRKSGLPDALRSINTKSQEIKKEIDISELKFLFKEDIQETGKLINRDLIKEWNV